MRTGEVPQRNTGSPHCLLPSSSHLPQPVAASPFLRRIPPSTRYVHYPFLNGRDYMFLLRSLKEVTTERVCASFNTYWILYLFFYIRRNLSLSLSCRNHIFTITGSFGGEMLLKIPGRLHGTVSSSRYIHYNCRSLSRDELTDHLLRKVGGTSSDVPVCAKHSIVLIFGSKNEFLKFFSKLH